MIKRIRFGLFVVILLTAAILEFGYKSNWGSGIVLIGLALDFCLYTYSFHSNVDSDMTENLSKFLWSPMLLHSLSYFMICCLNTYQTLTKFERFS